MLNVSMDDQMSGNEPVSQDNQNTSEPPKVTDESSVPNQVPDEIHSAETFADSRLMKHSHWLVYLYIVAALLVVAGAGLYAWRHKSTHKTGSSQVVATSHTNVWTGQGNSTNWSNPKNWSLGLPRNNQNIEINLSDISGSSAQKQVNSTFNMDINGLDIKNLTITGNNPNLHYILKGAPLNLSGGIYDTASSTSPAVSLELPIIFDANSTVSMSPKSSGLNFSTLEFGSHQLNVAGVVNINTIDGSGELNFMAGTALAESTFSDPSAAFSGKVLIGANNVVNMAVAQVAPNNYVSAFGSGSISIEGGGSLSIVSSTSNPVIANAISIIGNGPFLPPPARGNYGSLNLSACSSNIDATFTSQVSLAGNADVGCTFSTPLNSAKNTTTADFKQLSTGKYHVSEVPGSNVSIL